ncbi:MAG: hypothetical protein ACSW8I_04120 [bacterium]
MTPEEQYRRILGNHLPKEAVEGVYDYLNLHKVHFHITRERRSKLGDYRWPQPQHPFHEISVNGDLNPYRFLWVFLHEAAHLETHLKYTGAMPHGHEWQSEFGRLLTTHAAWFPAEVQTLIAQYTRRIPLAHRVGKSIEELLQHYDPDYDPAHTPLRLDDLHPGDRFRLKNRPAKLFQVEELRRTCWLCLDLDSGHRYTVRGNAEIIPC